MTKALLALLFLYSQSFSAKLFGDNRTNISQPITLSLNENYQATSEVLRLQDIISTQTTTTSTDILETSLGISPLLGKEIMLRRGDIDVILRRNHPYATWNWTGAQTCLISRPASLISETQVTELIETALRSYVNKEGTARILKLLNYTPFLIPKEGSNLEVELISPNANTPFGSATINVEYRDRSFTRRAIRFEWEWKKPIWIALDRQDSGFIQSHGFILESRNILEIKGEPLSEESLPTNVVLIRPILKGEPLLRTNLKTPLAVASGSPITAQIHTGTLLVSMKAIALENGSIGQTIHIENPQSRRKLLGKVIQENMVEVTP